MLNSLEPNERITGLERVLEQRSEELKEARKELADLAYSVSHDLRAPLRHLNGYLQILTEDCGPVMEAHCRESLAKVQNAARDLGEMLEALLELARLGGQEMHRQHVALVDVANAVVRTLSDEMPAREVEWKIGALPTADCDPALMKKLFFNLLSNSLKFTHTRPRAMIEVGTVEQDGQRVIFVRDNGIGFDMKYADKLFTIFQRLHREREFVGRAVGLAIVQRILRKHGGRIWAEAAVDQGAIFYFTLEAAQASGF
ncbi:MAG: ATP-binding protein [Candidatus Angelobacter sp.]